MYKKIAFILFFFLIDFINAQVFNLTDTLYINDIGQQNGLLQLNVKEMALDDLGYLWLGTEDGLNRFNGYTFKTYFHNPNDSTSIKDDHIRSLLFTKDTLWIATNTVGISGFIPSKNKFFTPFSIPQNTDLNTSYKILKLGTKQLLFSVKNNFIVFNRRTKKQEIVHLPKSSKENFVKDVLQLDKNNFWFATNSTGILEFNNITFKLTPTNILKNQNVQCFNKIENKIFIGTKKGLFLYNSQTKELQETSLKASIKCFYSKNNKSFYIGTDKGIYLFNTDNFSITSLVLNNQKNKLYKVIDVNQMIGDKKGNLWIGTDGNGLIHYNNYQKKFNTLKLKLKEYPNIDNLSSFQFLKGKDSTLWIGSKYGIVKYFHSKNRFKLYKNTKNQLIYTIIKDKNKMLWAGGFTTGLLKYNIKEDVFIRIKDNNALLDDDVIEIIPIDQNTLWVCTWSGGIHKFDIKEETFEEVLIEGEKIDRARISLIDSKGNIWIGTDQGVYKISKGGITKRYHERGAKEQRLSSNRIFSIQEDEEENIWFGTSVGLTKLDVKSDKTSLYFKQDGLPNDFIYSVLIAKNKDIWMGTNYGISVLDTKTLTFKNYTINDGLQNNEFNGKSGYKDEYGNFYFGGISGINIFNSDNLEENPFMPSVQIESVDLFNKPIQKNVLFKDSLVFESDENVITFNFSALNYLNPEKVNYTFKMEGFDKNWRKVTKDRNTTYTNLDSGNYIFKVKSTNDSGVWNNESDAMHIIINSPWYQTLLFKGAVLFLFLLSGPLFYNLKTTKLKKDKLKLEHEISERTQEIILKNENLKQVNNEVENQNSKIQFLMKEMRHRIKNNLQIISSLLNIQANSMEYEPAVDALKLARTRILAISFIENNKTSDDDLIKLDSLIKKLTKNIITVLTDGKNLEFKVVYDLSKTPIKNVNTTLIGLILNELVTNTVKYAFEDYHPDNKLKISCKVEESLLKMIISDNGIGYFLEQKASSKSLGIELVTEMVDQLKGTIIINSNNGTENIITIPI